MKSFSGPNRTELYTLVDTPSGRAWGTKPGHESITSKEVREAAHAEVVKHLAAKKKDKDLNEEAEPDVQPKEEPVNKKEKEYVPVAKKPCPHCGKENVNGQHIAHCKRNPKASLPTPRPREIAESIRKVNEAPADPDISVPHPIEELVLPFDAKDECDIRESNTAHTEAAEIPAEHLHDEDDVVIRKDLEEHRGEAIIVEDDPKPKTDPLASFRKHIVMMVETMEAAGHGAAYAVEEVKSIAGHTMTISITVVERKVTQ